MSAADADAAPRAAAGRRRRGSFVLLRRVDVDSPVHRLWAGTKLVAVAALSVTLSYEPTWPAIGLVALLLAGTMALARVPLSAIPRLPIWAWIGILAGLAFTFVSGGKPDLSVGSVSLGVGDAESYVQFVLVAFELLGAAALVGWTTDLGDVAPALATLLRPLRLLRLPVDEWAVASGLCIRALPLVIGEVRVLVAVRRMRPRTNARRLDAYLEDLVEMLAASITVSLRRASEMAEAISARGGIGSAGRTPRPRARDAAAGLVIAAVCAAPWLLPQWGLSS